MTVDDAGVWTAGYTGRVLCLLVVQQSSSAEMWKRFWDMSLESTRLREVGIGGRRLMSPGRSDHDGRIAQRSPACCRCPRADCHAICLASAGRWAAPGNQHPGRTWGDDDELAQDAHRTTEMNSCPAAATI